MNSVRLALLSLACTLWLTPVAPAIDAAPAKPYRYSRLGNPADVTTKTAPGFALIGGGTDLDPAFQWLCRRSGGGDFLVLRARGTNDYNPYIRSLCHVNSVATLILPTRQSAFDPSVAGIIRHAEAIFIAGGDQANYINYWQGTPVQTAINEAIHAGKPVGGTSAGLAVQGEYIYSAQHDPEDGPDLTSQAALSNPFQYQIVFAQHLLDDSSLKGVITDSHFVTRDRMGRLVVFLTRLMAARHVTSLRGLGIDEQTAVLLTPDGHADVVGKSAAYFLETHKPATQLQPGKPLTASGIQIQRVRAGGSFNFPAWTSPDATHYQLDVRDGVVHSTQPTGALY